MNRGDLYQALDRSRVLPPDTLVQIERTYDKRDIDPDCPMSVAIIPMVEVFVLSGEKMGRKLKWSRQSFRRKFLKIEVEDGN